MMVERDGGGIEGPSRLCNAFLLSPGRRLRNIVTENNKFVTTKIEICPDRIVQDLLAFFGQNLAFRKLPDSHY